MLQSPHLLNKKQLIRITPTIQNRTKYINFRKSKMKRNELLEKKAEAATRYNENIMHVKNIYRVQLIGEDDKKLGIMSTEEAIEMAKKLSLRKHRLCVVLVDVYFMILTYTLFNSILYFCLPHILIFSTREIHLFVDSH
jgi:hypothetical protein